MKRAFLQVARRVDPADDAAVVVAIREAVGPGVTLRADANRLWSLEKAVAFGIDAQAANLQVSTLYIDVL